MRCVQLIFVWLAMTCVPFCFVCGQENDQNELYLPSNWQNIIFKDEIQQELKLTTRQKESLKLGFKAARGRNAEKSRQRAEMWHAKNNGDKNFDKEKFERLSNEIRQDYDNFYNVIVRNALDEDQFKRFRQLSLWHFVNFSPEGFTGFLLFGPVMKELDVDAGQIREIRKHSAELQEQFERDLQKLKQKYRTKLINSLNIEQQKKLKTLLGKESPLHEIRTNF